MVGDVLPKRAQAALCAAILAALCGKSALAMTITVDDASDSVSATGCTLRGALSAINAQAFLAADPCSTSATGTFGGNDTVQFASALKNSIISLEQGQVMLTSAVDLQGSGQVLDAGGKSPIAYVLSGFYQNYANFGVHIANVTLTNGSAPAGFAGGALTVSGGVDVELDHVALSNNTLHGGGGGAMHVTSNAAVTLANCTVTGNTAISNSNSLSAGGVSVDRSTLRIVHSTISSNQMIATQASSRLAGGIVSNRGTLDIVGSTIANNAVHGPVTLAAGGLLSRSTAISVVNSTFTGNLVAGTDSLGGAMVLMAAYDNTGVTLLDSTIAGNTSSGGTSATGGILLYEEGYTFPFVLTNSILSHNFGISPDLALGGGFPATQINAQWDLLGTATQSIVSGATLVFSDAPGLGALGDNGGPTQTLALDPSSPAIGVGDIASAAYNGVPLLFDQRGDGHARALDGSLDLGAYQTQGDRVSAASFETGP